MRSDQDCLKITLNTDRALKHTPYSGDEAILVLLLKDVQIDPDNLKSQLNTFVPQMDLSENLLNERLWLLGVFEFL